MSVGQKCMHDPGYVCWHNVPLNEWRVECIINQNSILLSSIRKVWPVESVSTVVLIDATLKISFLDIILFCVTFVNVHSIQIQMVSNFHQCLHVTVLRVNSLGHNLGIKHFQKPRFDCSVEGGVEILVLRVQDIDVSIVVFAGHEVKIVLMVDYVSQSLVLDPRKYVLVMVVVHVMLFSCWEYNLFEVVWYLNYNLLSSLNISNWSDAWRVLDVKNVNIVSTINATCNIAVEIVLLSILRVDYNI